MIKWLWYLVLLWLRYWYWVDILTVSTLRFQILLRYTSSYFIHGLGTFFRPFFGLSKNSEDEDYGGPFSCSKWCVAADPSRSCIRFIVQKSLIKKSAFCHYVFLAIFIDLVCIFEKFQTKSILLDSLLQSWRLWPTWRPHHKAWLPFHNLLKQKDLYLDGLFLSAVAASALLGPSSFKVTW